MCSRNLFAAADLIFRVKNVNFVNQSIRKTLHTDRFLSADLLDFLHEVPGLTDFPFFSSRNPRGFLEESSKIMHEEVGGVSSFRPPNW